MKVLLTRPHNDSLSFKMKLKSLGFQSVIVPLIKIEKVDFDKKVLEKNFDLMIFTSKNAIKCFINNSKKNTKVFAIGLKTYQLAKDFGYRNVISANGNSISVINLFKKVFKKEKIKILHPTMKKKDSELEDYFLDQGSCYEKVIVYKSKKVNFFPKKFKDFLKEDSGIITIFSLKTAESFINSVNLFNLKESCKDKTFFVISNNIKKSLIKLKSKDIIVLNEPYEENFFKYLNKGFLS